MSYDEKLGLGKGGSYGWGLSEGKEVKEKPKEGEPTLDELSNWIQKYFEGFRTEFISKLEKIDSILEKTNTVLEGLKPELERLQPREIAVPSEETTEVTVLIYRTPVWHNTKEFWGWKYIKDNHILGKEDLKKYNLKEVPKV